MAPDDAVQLSGSYQLNGIACVTAVTCWAVGTTGPPGIGGIVVPIDDGVPGSVTFVPGTTMLSGISCFSWNLGEICNAVGSNGGQGVLVPMDVTPPGDVSAPQFFSSAEPADPVSGTSDLVSISCPSSSTCEAVGTNNGYPGESGTNGVIVPIANIDSSGNFAPLPGTAIEETATHYLSGVACPSDGNCVVVGTAGSNDVVIPITKGAAGSLEAVTAGDAFTGVACPSTNTCDAVDAGIYGPGEVVPIKNGVPGTPVVDPNASFDAISCISSTTMCVGAGEGTIPTPAGSIAGAAVVPIDNGVPGATVPLPNDSQPSTNGSASGPFSLDGIDCPSSTQCFSVGNAMTQPDRYSAPVFTTWADTIQVTLPSR